MGRKDVSAGEQPTQPNPTGSASAVNAPQTSQFVASSSLLCSRVSCGTGCWLLGGSGGGTGKGHQVAAVSPCSQHSQRPPHGLPTPLGLALAGASPSPLSAADLKGSVPTLLLGLH